MRIDRAVYLSFCCVMILGIGIYVAIIFLAEKLYIQHY